MCNAENKVKFYKIAYIELSSWSSLPIFIIVICYFKQTEDTTYLLLPIRRMIADNYKITI